jgi:UDP-glucose-4-epimerase GalE
MTHTILVTGGAGFIGSTACKALAKEGFTPIVLDNLSTGYKEFIKWGPHIDADMANEEAVREIFSRFNPSAILHFAAFINVGESVLNPAKYYENNVAKSALFLSHVQKINPIPIVFSSTAAVFGEPLTPLIDEHHPKSPINPYGLGKLYVEHMLADFEKAYGQRHVIFRYFNAAGSEPDLEVGEAHIPETHLIPLAIRAVNGGPPLKLFGDDYDTPDGTCIRDYIHVSDLADAHVMAVKYLLDGGKSASFNLGNGLGFSVKEVVEAVSRCAGKPVPFEKVGRREGDPARLVADASLVKQVLEWQPRYPDLDTIVNHAYKWAMLKHRS